MASTISSNMSLTIPTVGQEASPTWAQDLNASLTIIDQHNHSAGSGVQINPSGININTSLPFNNNFATNLAGVTLTGQASSPANGTIYSSNNSSGDLYFINSAGLAIQLTNASGIVGSPGSISGISGAASASYSSPTFFWRSATGIAANMDFGAAIMRNVSPNSTYALTLQPPASLSSNYSLTLPTIPAAQNFLSIDNSGNIAAYTPVSGGITGSNIASGTITASNIANSTITGTQVVSNVNLPGKAVQVNGHNVVSSNVNNTNGLQIIRATMNGSTILAGEGFTCSGVATGEYTVTFTNAFADSPAITATVVTGSGNPYVMTISGSSNSFFTTQIFNSETNTPVNSTWNFIAIGQAP